MSEASKKVRGKERSSTKVEAGVEKPRPRTVNTQRSQTAEDTAQAKEIAERMQFLGVTSSTNGPPDIQIYIRRLQDLVPNLDDDRATMLLSENDFNVDATADQILEGSKSTDWSDVKSRKQRLEAGKAAKEAHKTQPPVCFYCSEVGHKKDNCPKKHIYEKKTQPVRKPTVPSKPVSVPVKLEKVAEKVEKTDKSEDSGVEKLSRKQRKLQKQPTTPDDTNSAPSVPSKTTTEGTPALQEQEASSEVDESLLCPMCHNLYSDPRMLDCLHSVCFECLGKLVLEETPEHFTCPVCNSPTDRSSSVPSNHALATAVETERAARRSCENCDQHASTSFCYDCKAFLCSECTTSIHAQRIAQKHTVVGAATKKQTTRTCRTHDGEKLALYCVKCLEVVCSHCMLVGAHRTHECVALKDVSSQTRDMLTKQIMQTQEKQKHLIRTFEDMDASIAAVNSSYSAAVQNLQHRFTELHHALEQRLQTLLGSLATIKENKTRALLYKQDELRLYLQQVKEGWGCAQQLLELCDGVELTDMKKAIEKRLKSVNMLDVVPPPGDNSVSLVLDSDIDQAIAMYGGVGIAKQQLADVRPGAYNPTNIIFGSQQWQQ